MLGSAGRLTVVWGDRPIRLSRADEVMLPTLSSAIHLTVVTPSAERLNEALAPATSVPFVTLSLLSIAGSLPSVE